MKLKEALDKIASLEKRISDLEARPLVIEHHHHHYPPVQFPRPEIQPSWPYPGAQIGPYFGDPIYLQVPTCTAISSAECMAVIQN